MKILSAGTWAIPKARQTHKTGTSRPQKTQKTPQALPHLKKNSNFAKKYSLSKKGNKQQNK
ncbi:MAG: hypothetical protein SPL64_03305 [Bacteroidaceae bacterium]|nr:hypothetical protein [Bacteroidaceae bacterium]